MTTTSLFVCHASEDKETFARPLALHLQGLGYSVWFDQFALTLGDSLRRKIDEGLAKCDFGVVILSPAFFQKEWPQRELDGLTARETAEKRKVILPIWYNVTLKEVRRQSPTLADRIAIRASEDLGKIGKAIQSAVGDESRLRRELVSLEADLYDANMRDGYDDGYDGPSTKIEIAALKAKIKIVKNKLDNA